VARREARIPDDRQAIIEWEASLAPGLLEGLAHIHVLASPSIPSWNQIAAFLESMRQLREAAKFVA
jgi:hypothetical protein